MVIYRYFFSGDNVTEMRVKFLKKIEDTVPAGDDWIVPIAAEVALPPAMNLMVAWWRYVIFATFGGDVKWKNV
jgi:hypothetical protein